MGKQLEINFNTGQHYHMSVGDKRDFVVYNANDYKLLDVPIRNKDLVELKWSNKVINKLKSYAWSSNCVHFFVFQDEGIYLFNVYSDKVWLCKKHSKQFIEMYLSIKNL